MRTSLITAVVLALCMGGLLSAQAAEPGTKAKPKTWSINIGGNEVSNESGVIEEGAEIEGITIINGEVSIDGVKVPRGVKKYRSPKSGKTYRIEWGKGDNVSVSEQ